MNVKEESGILNLEEGSGIVNVEEVIKEVGL